MLRLVSGVAIASLWFAACGDDAPPPADSGPADAGSGDAGPPDGGPLPFAPDLYCPGSPDCPDEGDGVLSAGAAAVEITPVIGPTTDIQTLDNNGNGEWDPGDGDEFEDRNGNGLFDGVFIAGFGNARAASGVHDPIWARAIALRHDATTIVLVSLDFVGWFWDDVVRIREMVGDLDVDYVMVSATHTHEGPDTMGIWGVSVDQTGVNEAYMETARAGAAQAIRMAVAALEPANVQYATTQLRDAEGGTYRYVSDARDPIIIDDEIRIVRFVRAGMADATIATMINFGSHPEYTGSRNQLLSSDLAHWLRQGVEDGLVGPDGEMVDGVGGIAVFFNGAVGVQIGPGEVEAVAWDGTVLGDDQNLLLAETVGTQLAHIVLGAIGDTAAAVTDETARLAFKNRTFFVDVENRAYHIALLTPLFPTRMAYNWDPDFPLVPGENEPDIRTEIAILDVGRMRIVAMPGEIDPSLWLGGYDGSYTPAGQIIVDMTRENPPDLTMAPAGPYLRDLAAEDGAEILALFGLANDEIGYFVPEYDYELNSSLPYILQAPGEHYEETNSVGENGWPRIENELRMLIAWEPG